MHELSIAQGVVDIVHQYVPPAEIGTVTAVRVRIGALSGVVPESLEFCFNAIAAETPLSRARLEIERVPTVAGCSACGVQFEPDGLVFLCPSCGGGRVQLVSGNDLQVVHVELDETRRNVNAPERRGALGPPRATAPGGAQGPPPIKQ